jgi:hypothetical protein
MNGNGESTLRKVVHDIRKEARRQIRGSREELRRQLITGWGQEFAHQMFGIPRQRRRRLSR